MKNPTIVQASTVGAREQNEDRVGHWTSPGAVAATFRCEPAQFLMTGQDGGWIVTVVQTPVQPDDRVVLHERVVQRG